MILAGLFFYHQQSSNSELVYWEYMINQDPKPKHISEEGYFLGNQKGMCWRDNKIYSKDELYIQAIKGFTQVLLREIELERNEKVPNYMSINGDYHHGTAAYCKNNSFGCKLWLIDNGLSFNQIKSIWNKLFSTKEKMYQFISSKSHSLIEDNAFLSERKLNRPMLVHTSFFSDEIYPSDCCEIINKKAFQTIKNKKIIKESYNKTLNNQFKAILPDVLLEQYGVGHFYFVVKSIKVSHVNEYFQEDYHIYFINNCGDILVKPYFSFNP